jgi:hypothetical protein
MRIAITSVVDPDPEDPFYFFIKDLKKFWIVRKKNYFFSSDIEFCVCYHFYFKHASIRIRMCSSQIWFFVTGIKNAKSAKRFTYYSSPDSYSGFRDPDPKEIFADQQDWRHICQKIWHLNKHSAG